MFERRCRRGDAGRIRTRQTAWRAHPCRADRLRHERRRLPLRRCHRPTATGARRAMLNALRDAEIAPEDVDYINAHGTSTPAGDKSKRRRQGGVWRSCPSVGDEFDQIDDRSPVGRRRWGGSDFLGAGYPRSGGAATINLDEPEPGCDLNYVPHQTQERRVRVALSNSFGFGGTNGTVVFRALIDLAPCCCSLPGLFEFFRRYPRPCPMGTGKAGDRSRSSRANQGSGVKCVFPCGFSRCRF